MLSPCQCVFDIIAEQVHSSLTPRWTIEGVSLRSCQCERQSYARNRRRRGAHCGTMTSPQQCVSLCMPSIWMMCSGKLLNTPPSVSRAELPSIPAQPVRLHRGLMPNPTRIRAVHDHMHTHAHALTHALTYLQCTIWCTTSCAWARMARRSAVCMEDGNARPGMGVARQMFEPASALACNSCCATYTSGRCGVMLGQHGDQQDQTCPIHATCPLRALIIHPTRLVHPFNAGPK